MTAVSPRKGPWGSPVLWFWLSAKTLSDISAAINTIIISIYMLSITGSPFSLGLLLACRMAGSVVGAFCIPYASRYFSPSSILIFCDVLSALCMFVLVLSPATSDVLLLYPIVFCIGGLHGGFLVVIMSQSPNFMGYEMRHRMNAILGSISGVAIVAGGITASIIYVLLPVKIIFLLDGATFLLAAIIFAFTGRRLTSDRTQTTAASRNAAQPSSVKRRWVQFISAARVSLIALGAVIAARFTEAFGSSTHNVGFPILSEAYDAGNPAFLFGWIMAFWGLGKMCSTFATPNLLHWMEKNGRSIAAVFYVCLIITFALFLAVFEAPGLPLMLILGFCAGFFDGSTETAYYSILQSSPPEAKESVISFSYFIERAGMGMGILLVGHSFSVLGTETTPQLFYGGSILVILVLVGFGFWRRQKNRRIEN
ncbi:MAG: MFS transporter [Pseudomonadota bacterium]